MEEAVRQFRPTRGLQPSGVLQEQAAARTDAVIKSPLSKPESDDRVHSFVVCGCVREADGTPLGEGTERVFHKGLRSEIPLGQVPALR